MSAVPKYLSRISLPFICDAFEQYDKIKHKLSTRNVGAKYKIRFFVRVYRQKPSNHSMQLITSLKLTFNLLDFLSFFFFINLSFLTFLLDGFGLVVRGDLSRSESVESSCDFLDEYLFFPDFFFTPAFCRV